MEVNIVDCPDLTQPPFQIECQGKNRYTYSPTYYVYETKLLYFLTELIIISGNITSESLSGNPNIIDLGTRIDLISKEQFETTYDLDEILEKINLLQTKIIGPGMESLVADSSKRLFKSFIASLYSSDGMAGKVVKIKCKGRVTEAGFLQCIQSILKSGFEGKTIGIGGVFIQKTGQTKLRKEFQKEPEALPKLEAVIRKEENMLDLLELFNVSAPLIATGVIITDKFDLQANCIHFHTLNHEGVRGHFCTDITPDQVEYEAYFNVAQAIYRVDRPSHVTEDFAMIPI